MWEGHLVGLEILRLFYNRSTALLRKTYLSVSHPCSATLTSLSEAYWTSHSLNKVVVLPVGLVFLSVDTSFSSHEICPLLFFWCRQICGAWDKLSWKILFLWSWMYCLSAQSRAQDIADKQWWHTSSSHVLQSFCFQLETQKWEAMQIAAHVPFFLMYLWLKCCRWVNSKKECLLLVLTSNPSSVLIAKSLFCHLLYVPSVTCGCS